MLAADFREDEQDKAATAEKALKQAREVELILQNLKEQPALGFPYSQLSQCYALLNMPEECIHSYEKAASFSTSMDHFAPNVRAGKATAAFCARFFLFVRNIYNLKSDGDFSGIGPNGIAWMNSFPEVLTFQTCILLGMFFGYEGSMRIDRRIRVSMNGDCYIEHCWLVMPELDMAFDPCIRNRNTGILGQVFRIDDHPLLHVSDEEVRKIQSEGFSLCEPEFTFVSLAMIAPNLQAALEEVNEALNHRTTNATPTIQELRRVYLNGIANVPVPE